VSELCPDLCDVCSAQRDVFLLQLSIRNQKYIEVFYVHVTVHDDKCDVHVTVHHDKCDVHVTVHHDKCDVHVTAHHDECDVHVTVHHDKYDVHVTDRAS
jgi:hypothetical protein